MSSGYQSGGGSYNSLPGSGGAGGGGAGAAGGADGTVLHPGEEEEEDDDEDEEGCGGDVWPPSRALPFPRWGCGRPELVLPSLPQHTAFVARLTPMLQAILRQHPYDTVSNFVRYVSQEGGERGVR